MHKRQDHTDIKMYKSALCNGAYCIERDTSEACTEERGLSYYDDALPIYL